MSGRPECVTARLKPRLGKHHDVELEPKAAAGVVTIDVLRPRRDAKSDEQLSLTPTEARALMKKLQSRADEADRLAYQAEKERRRLEQLDELEPVVRELAAKGIR